MIFRISNKEEMKQTGFDILMIMVVVLGEHYFLNEKMLLGVLFSLSCMKLLINHYDRSTICSWTRSVNKTLLMLEFWAYFSFFSTSVFSQKNNFFLDFFWIFQCLCSDFDSSFLGLDCCPCV